MDALPDQAATSQLELAQAAAARSCADLRCSSVQGAADGPAAGSGAGSKRCAACRAVHYCGTACAHADWRAGHKQACKLLQQERQQQQQSQQGG